MKIQIKAHHISITSALKEYAEKKVEKLERFFENIQEIVIDLDISSSSNDDEKQVASALVSVSGKMIRAQEASASMYSSIDVLLDKLEVQLKKHKEKLTERRREGSAHRELIIGKAKGRAFHNIDNEKRFVPKPMDPEDAVTLLERDHLSFLVFRNMDERICVVYPLGKNEYGLVET